MQQAPSRLNQAGLLTQVWPWIVCVGGPEAHSSLNPNTDPIKVQPGSGSARHGHFEWSPSLAGNEEKTLNMTLKSALRHEIEIVSVPRVRLWDEVHLKMKRKSCLYNLVVLEACWSWNVQLWQSFSWFWVLHACVWIPGSDYSYVKYRVVVVAFVECDATLLRMEREDRPNFSHTWMHGWY